MIVNRRKVFSLERMLYYSMIFDNLMLSQQCGKLFVWSGHFKLQVLDNHVK
jgi:hypothetical protein